jgi:type IV pilus assembly protein PilM
MSFLNQITRLVKDPPPSHLFELSEAGLAYAQGTTTGFQAFEPGTLVASPVEDNILRGDAILSTIQRLTPAGAAKKRRGAAVILPDYAARVTVLDFDSFPTVAEEQASLVRFRVKKTIPFDIDSAAVSYFPQTVAGQKRVEVVAVTVALEVIARYEAVFRSAGYHPGVVTTSTLAALNLDSFRQDKSEGVAVLAKLSGRALTVAVIAAGAVKLFRCVSIEESSPGEAMEEIMAVLHPTFAYIEDELKQPVGKMILCGVPEDVAARLKCESETLGSRFGTPGPYNAGLFGYLEQVVG